MGELRGACPAAPCGLGTSGQSAEWSPSESLSSSAFFLGRIVMATNLHRYERGSSLKVKYQESQFSSSQKNLNRCNYPGVVLSPLSLLGSFKIQNLGSSLFSMPTSHSDVQHLALSTLLFQSASSWSLAHEITSLECSRIESQRRYDVLNPKGFVLGSSRNLSFSTAPVFRTNQTPLTPPRTPRSQQPGLPPKPIHSTREPE